MRRSANNNKRVSRCVSAIARWWLFSFRFFFLLFGPPKCEGDASALDSMSCSVTRIRVKLIITWYSRHGFLFTAQLNTPKRMSSQNVFAHTTFLGLHYALSMGLPEILDSLLRERVQWGGGEWSKTDNYFISLHASHSSFEHFISIGSAQYEHLRDKHTLAGFHQPNQSKNKKNVISDRIRYLQASLKCHKGRRMCI